MKKVAKKKPAKKAKAVQADAADVSIESRLAAVEAKTRYMSIVMHHDPAVGDIPGVYFAGCRVGFNTDFWMRRNAGQGATLAVGNDYDQYGIYVENEGKQPAGLNGPSVAIAANALAVGPHENWAFHGVAFNSTATNATLVTQVADRYSVHRYEGMELRGSWPSSGYMVGMSYADAKRVW